MEYRIGQLAKTADVNIETIRYYERQGLMRQHQIKQPWHWQAKEQAYFFCDDLGCDVVYFGEDNSVIKQSALRSRVGIKKEKVDSMICYCFDVRNEDYQNNKSIKDYVTEQTKNKTCDCEIRSPSGKCCLKNFPKPN